MSDRMNREDIRKELVKMGHPLASDRVIDRVMECLDCHHLANDPMAAFIIQSVIIEENLRAFRGDVHHVAEEAAKIGATEGAKDGAVEGMKSVMSDLTDLVVNMSSGLREWLDKGFVGLTANTRLMRSFQQQMEKGKGVTLKVDQVALSPQTRREVITAIPEAMMRAVIAEQQRPIRRANAVIFGLTLTVIVLLTALAAEMRESASRPTEKTVHWALNDVSAKANKVFEQLLADRQMNPHASIIPRDVALTGAKLMTDRVVELALGQDDNGLTNEHRSWKYRLWDWADKYQVGTVIMAALMVLTGYLCGKGWR